MPKEYPRRLRINVQMQRELIGLIRDELTDPRVAHVTVTKVDVTPDLRQARVMISVLGPEEQLKPAVDALNHAAPKLRHGLGRKMQLRYTPQLHFSADLALREGDRVGALIREATNADRLHAQERGEKDE